MSVDRGQVRRDDREVAESLIRNAPKWDDNEKPVDPAIHRLWIGYGVRLARAYLALLAELEQAGLYPHKDGDVTVLGPEIFASDDREVICWQGENYVKQARVEQAEKERNEARKSGEHYLEAWTKAQAQLVKVVPALMEALRKIAYDCGLNPSSAAVGVAVSALTEVEHEQREAFPGFSGGLSIGLGVFKVPALMEDGVQLRAALDELLDVATRIRGGDTNLDSERWYAARDYAQHVIAESVKLAAVVEQEQR